ncbi:MAG: hypothetical protein KIT18_15370, partial [Burkholderiales bacterium]|nr:hypothetical protein [Burkholderiales bacterium]
MTDERRMAQSLFDFFARSGMPYCVVGDTRGYACGVASDVDVVVPKEAFSGIPQLIAQFCREQDARIVQMIRHEQTAVYFVLAWTGGEEESRFLAVDICSDYRRSGRLLLTAEEILAQREPAADADGVACGFYVPPAPMQFIYYLLKKIDKQEIGDSHGDCLSALWSADPSCAWNEIGRFWPGAEDADLIAEAASSNDWATVRSALPQLKRSLHRAAPLSLRGLLGEVRRWAGRVLRPTGLVIVVLGPDGCGKSSVIEHMLGELAPVFRRSRYFHLRPRVCVDGGVVPMVVTQPHALPARGTLASLAKLAYFLFDYFSGWLLRVWPSAIRSTLVVFDRYYHDLLVDPLRFRYGGPVPAARWLASCIPSPDMWLLLDAPADVLQTRKSEVSADESERQRRAYLRLVNRRWNATVIDASRGIAQVCAEAEDAVLRFLEQRIERRNPELRFRENPVSARLLLFFCQR